MDTDERLIDVAFPITQASIDSMHEKNVRYGHLSNLHIWPEALHQLGRVAYAQGDYDQALARCADGLALARVAEDAHISTMIERTMDAVVRARDAGSL